MKKVALIPARYASTRFPAKLVQDLCGMSVIQRTYLSTVQTGVFDQVVVVTDHQAIADQIIAVGGEVFFSTREFESGSDRIAEAARNIDADIFVNVQGDEPFQDRQSLDDLTAVFSNSEVQVASMMFSISAAEAQNPNAVKVVLDKDSFALYFSRSPIPYIREKGVEISYWKHVGIYAYRKEALLAFTGLPKSFLETTEMLEQLRLLENGVNIKMVPTTHQAIAVDTKEDLERAVAWCLENKLF
ncbi:3-deoxy-manno-octulosonate cytidylyltransferase [Cognataquiflexum rubidum]|uniref:3-deoxy-manno-octulosonate cytidylyltransferase n=1 Tax=Cognataquiflexum rubidum TaxID=2922273 RepID=UPI001F134D6F|nr:3-deoxy-manno-octulosonate cytidylyltransferase [Cognataquiflexum rubidum]MCH6236527.1 3-deoxy-manno-octulosonate cytidylyltransferase [Cognataquiflexum rubidum]